MKQEASQLPSPPKPRRTRIVFATVIAAFLVAAVWLVRSRNDNLIELSRHVGRLQGQTVSGTISPQWISNHEAIFLSYHADGDRFEFTRLDADTGSQIPIPELNQLYVKELRCSHFAHLHGSNNNHEPPGYAISHDHNLLLMAPSNHPPPTFAMRDTNYYVTDLTGGNRVSWKRSKQEDYAVSPVWLADNKRWVVPDWSARKGNVTVRDVGRPNNTFRPVTAAGPAGMYLPLFLSHRNTLWCVSINGLPSSTVTVSEWDIFGDSALQTRQIKLPGPGRIEAAAPSPNGDRTAWLFSYEHTSPLAKLAHRMFNKIPAKTYYLSGLWISDEHGNNMKEIGIAPVFRSIGSIQWLPDSKRISFVFGSDLYIIPIDR
jgi:hypothetical protein